MVVIRVTVYGSVGVGIRISLGCVGAGLDIVGEGAGICVNTSNCSDAAVSVAPVIATAVAVGVLLEAVEAGSLQPVEHTNTNKNTIKAQTPFNSNLQSEISIQSPGCILTK